MVLYFLFNLSRGHHSLEGRLGISAFLRPDAMTPVNFLNCPLIIHALFKRQRSVENLRRRFLAEESEQRCARERTYSYANQSDQHAPSKQSGSPIGPLFHGRRRGGK